MKHNLSSGIAILTACAALMMTACGQSGQNVSTGASSQADTTAAEITAGTEPAAENVEYKSEINVAIAANPPSLDPQSVNSNIVGGIGIHIYEPFICHGRKL